MKKISLYFLIAVVGIMSSACAAAGPKESAAEVVQPAETEESAAAMVQPIKPEEAKKRLDSEKGIILLDVRTQQEYEEGHIPNSVLIPVDVIGQEAPKKLTDKDAAIFVYCRSGRRSAVAAEALIKMGYKRVYDLGGINNWPYETVKGK